MEFEFVVTHVEPTMDIFDGKNVVVMRLAEAQTGLDWGDMRIPVELGAARPAVGTRVAVTVEFPTAITCPICGSTSHHPADVAEGYCGRCHAFTARCTFGCADPPTTVAGSIALCAAHARLVA